jgi:hypothetical protein
MLLCDFHYWINTLASVSLLKITPISISSRNFPVEAFRQSGLPRRTGLKVRRLDADLGLAKFALQS